MTNRAEVQHGIVADDLDLLLGVLPGYIAGPIRQTNQNTHLLEIVMDLGRLPQARYTDHEIELAETEVTAEDIDYVVAHIGDFGEDNRAGIERTLHRISCLRNRRGRIVGLTCRVGRAVFGTIQTIDDMVRSGRSILLLGRPGVGKTTMLREVARVLADDVGKRVVIVDTSNEIAGDGDIPHPAIGRARRMQVARPDLQHAVMIEAVENHMPEVIVIDEIGTELEAIAARTIAERGVQLVGTAHGNHLENLILNPTLADLIGGIQSVTLSDEEARRRGTQKSVLERKAPPTFDVVVEIQSWSRVAFHDDVAETVDALLRGYRVSAAIRELDDGGQVRQVSAREQQGSDRLDMGGARRGGPGPGGARGRERRDQRGQPAWGAAPEPPEREYRRPPVIEEPAGPSTRIYPYGVSRNRLSQAVRETRTSAVVVDHMDDADALLTLRSYFRRKPQALRDAEARGVPIYVLKNNTIAQMEQSLLSMREVPPIDAVNTALQETEDAIMRVMADDRALELAPQNAYVRRLQHQMAQRYNLASRSRGREPLRRVRLFPGEADDASA